jgi:hypothetical protein
MSLDYSIDRWVTRVARRQWHREEQAWRFAGDAIPQVILDHPDLAEVHRLDLSLFVVFEEAALRVSGALVRTAPDDDALNFCAQQTLDEARHLEIFQQRLVLAATATGTPAQPVESIMSLSLKAFIERCHEVVDRGDFIEGLTLMNLIFEGMAHPLYAYEERYWAPLDPFLASLVRSAFADESRHVGYGADLVRRAIAGNPAKRRAVSELCHEATLAMAAIFKCYMSSFVSLFDAAAKQHGELFGDAEFAPGRRIATTPYEEQVQTIHAAMEREHAKHLARAGLA